MQCILNQSITLPFISEGFTTGLTSFTPVVALLDGTVLTTQPSFTFLEVGGGLYTFTFTPNATGAWTIFIQGQLIKVDIVTRTDSSYLKNLEDECLGSWQWDKNAGTLTLIRQDSSDLAVFNVTDTLISASKERIG